MGGRKITLRELLLGFEGLAILRGLVDASDAEINARIEDIRRIAAGIDDPPFSLAMDVPELDFRTGYAKWSQNYDTIDNALLVAEQPVVEAITSAVRAGRALDAACGTGRHASHLVRTHDVVGVDASPEMLAIARQKVPGAEFIESDLCGIPLPDASFDVVVCALALCHFADLGPPVAELARLAKPGATVVFTDPHPISTFVISQAFFPTEDGGLAFVRNHARFIDDYLRVFERSELRVRACHEPVFEPQWAGGLAERFAPGVTPMALGGLPFAIVWELERT